MSKTKLPYKELREKIRNNIYFKKRNQGKKGYWKVDLKDIGLIHSEGHNFWFSLDYQKNKEEIIEDMIKYLKKYPEEFGNKITGEKEND